MAYHASQGNGSDQSTPWSEWFWDPNHSFWFTYRLNAGGAKEYNYHHSDRPEDQAATPRTPGLTDQSITSDQQSTYSSPSTSTDPNAYTISQANDYNDFDHNATPRPFYAAPVPVHGYYNPPDSVQNYDAAFTDHSNSTLPSEYPSSSNVPSQPNAEVALSSIDATTRGLDNMSLSTPHILPPGMIASHILLRTFSDKSKGAFEPEVNRAIIDAKHIFKEPNTGNAETLDPRYTLYGGFRRQDDFWKVGRVFMMLWTEPAQPKVPVTGGTRDGSHFSTTFLGEQAYRQATLKPNLSAPYRHTIIHTTPHAPEEHSYVANGQPVYENLVLDPIQVESERSHEPEGSLHPLSRLNYSKVYSVEHYVRVLNIGMVAATSIDTFLRQSGWSQGDQTVRSQRSSRRIPGHSSRNRRNRD
ncbi:hypothetical protein BOTCAL_0158g00070 [Botryotinia calthae]|uniref:DUF6590 domain-containing protein n=1 Tax=Botryotinia calthae TaxID=38488 RepID=A0A4Y8D4A6_9HELO|nr:hypothetical protein BOTCAL_0158g00070 [Botryotinia calthae]